LAAHPCAAWKIFFYRDFLAQNTGAHQAALRRLTAGSRPFPRSAPAYAAAFARLLFSRRQAASAPAQLPATSPEFQRGGPGKACESQGASFAGR
jgi:hypothetical protein